MMETNYRYSADLLDYCLHARVPLIYASSAAVYGASTVFKEGDPSAERPLNVYGYSKLLFDQYVHRVCRPRARKWWGCAISTSMARRSPQRADGERRLSLESSNGGALGSRRLFEGSHGYEAGEQRRDFVHVDDVVSVNLWFYEHRHVSGIFNVGTGKSASFNEVAKAIIDWHGSGKIQYIPFPEGLKARYQSYTQADIGALRAAGYDSPFLDVRAGVKRTWTRSTRSRELAPRRCWSSVRLGWATW